MSKEKQIEEMAKEIASILTEAAHMACEDIPFAPLDLDGPCLVNIECHRCKEARMLIAKGYRKQSEGEWQKRTFIIFDSEKVGYRCSECNTTWDVTTNYCPNCGAKMKGGAE